MVQSFLKKIGDLILAIGSLLALLVPPLLQMIDHLLLHHVNVVLLLTQTLARHIDVILQELELVFIDVAVLALPLQLLELGYFANLALLHFLLQFLLLVLLLLIVYAIFRATTLLLEHLVDHVLQGALRCRLFNLRPVLHDSILEFDTKLVLSQGLLIRLHTLPLIIVEDVVKRQWVERCVDYSFNLALLS